MRSARIVWHLVFVIYMSSSLNFTLRRSPPPFILTPNQQEALPSYRLYHVPGVTTRSAAYNDMNNQMKDREVSPLDDPDTELLTREEIEARDLAITTFLLMHN